MKMKVGHSGISEFSVPVTPVETSLAGAIVGYLLSVVVLRDFGSPGAAAVLLGFPSIAIAVVLVIAAYVGLWFNLARPQFSDIPARANDDLAEAFAADNRARTSVAIASRWWHHLFGAIAGLVFGVFLAYTLTWLFQ